MFSKENSKLFMLNNIDNNIRLIRIPYWNFDKIEEILLKELDV